MTIAMIRVGKGKRRIRFYLYSEDKKQKTNKRGRETIIHFISKIIEKEGKKDDTFKIIPIENTKVVYYLDEIKKDK